MDGDGDEELRRMWRVMTTPPERFFLSFWRARGAHRVGGDVLGDGLAGRGRMTSRPGDTPAEHHGWYGEARRSTEAEAAVGRIASRTPRTYWRTKPSTVGTEG